ncbi:response regulator [Gemmata sp. JC717]|uniref:Response regulator n=1 Tax=Gemmata algarum TaxID=2975278 RepID=A0ABU5ESD5_9BACT|nr:response regulator [Gemmata algarum]MDY3552963.1 response regulator [Gemmata algarum]MDY3558258.1 response regulator [Gemmata algarum]
MSLQVLFVDDEPNVLDGLRRTLREFRREWDMRFATGGPAALAALDQAPADVVVSDMRMPGMNGDELLAEVRARHPQTVRIVLSGECTREAMVRVTSLAHRVLTKPCDPVELRVAIQQAFALRGLLLSPRLSALAGRLQSVPSRPDLYARIRAVLEQPNYSLSELADICARDAGVSAKLIQLANSALFGSTRPTHCAFEAVSRIGAEMVRALILAEGVLTAFDARSIHPFSVSDVWPHSESVALLAARIVNREAPRAAWGGLAPAAGTLHDIGRLILACVEPAAYVEVLRRVQAGAMLVSAEADAFGATHATVGAYLLGLWGVPSSIVEAVAWHHNPGGRPADRFGLVTAVHAAASLLYPDDGGGPDLAYLNRLELGDRLPAWATLSADLGGGL